LEVLERDDSQFKFRPSLYLHELHIWNHGYSAFNDFKDMRTFQQLCTWRTSSCVFPLHRNCSMLLDGLPTGQSALLQSPEYFLLCFHFHFVLHDSVGYSHKICGVHVCLLCSVWNLCSSLNFNSASLCSGAMLASS